MKNFVKCMICGEKRKQICESTHLKLHNITKKEYLEKFPNAELVPINRKNHMSQTMKKTMRRRYFLGRNKNSYFKCK